MSGAKPAKKIPAHVNRLYKAVQNYVEKTGGKLFVIGGIQVQEWPGDNPGNFRLAVKCTGRMPKFAAVDERGQATAKTA